MSNQARHAYWENESLADPIELIRMLYRGGLDAVGKAKQRLAAGDVSGRSLQITRAGEILNELAASLDMERGGELAQRLLDLYDYMQRRLQDANFEQSEAPLTEVEGLMTTLLQGWEGHRAESAERNFVLESGSEGSETRLAAGISA